jgi:outer membrane receptor protein involved in Fe transport
LRAVALVPSAKEGTTLAEKLITGVALVIVGNICATHHVVAEPSHDDDESGGRAEPDVLPRPARRDVASASVEVITITAAYEESVLGEGFRTAIDVAAQSGETTSIAEILAESVGVSVRSLGGLGGFAAISIRGASPSHTALFIDGVPVSRIASVIDNVEALELASFSTLEVYRGAVPVEYGGAALGGALSLRTRLGPDRDGHIAHVAAGLGSFGSRHLRGRVSDVAFGERLRFHVGASYRGATGDYEYLNDNGTPLVTEDDAFVRRTNNGFDQVSGVARARYDWSRTGLELGVRSTWKQQGVPGAGSVQTTGASLDSLGNLLDGRVELTVADATRVGATLFLLDERQHYRDLRGEVGLGLQDNHYATMSAGSTGLLRHDLGPRHRLSLGLDGRVDRHVITDELAADPSGPRGIRLSSGVSLSDDVVVTERVRLVPALRVDYQWTEPGSGWDPIVVGPAPPQAYDDLYLSPRMSGRVLVGDLVLKASVGRYFRAPTLTELYGDRGYLLGNPLLRPETGINADAGLVLASQTHYGPVDELFIQTAAFVARPRSAIVLLQSAGGAGQAENLGDATIYGLEAALAFRVMKALTLTANYTYIDSRQDSPFASYDGKRLPLRPRHEAYTKVEGRVPVRRHVIRPWGDLMFTSGNYLDAANLFQVPSRLLAGVGLKAEIGEHLLFGFEVKNLTDKQVESITLDPPPSASLSTIPRAVSDFLGYPLPGRAFYVTSEASF